MRFITLILLAALIGCGTNRRQKYSPGPSRLKIERPGKGVQLEKELAELMLAGKRVQAMRLCNDVLFSSRSKNDREIANYWRTLLLVFEEVEEGNYKKASELIKKASKWWKNSTRNYHSKLLVEMMEKLTEKSNSVRNLRVRLKKEKEIQKTQLENLNQDLVKEMAELKEKNKKLEKLLHDLEKVK
jgi:hypothetical protein